MNNWQIDLFTGLQQSTNMQDVLDVTLSIVKPMGFEFCGWRSRLPLPLSKPHYAAATSQEDSVHEKISTDGYEDAPLVKHCSQSTKPFAWLGTTTDKPFLMAPELFEEYYSWGHRGGWGQSVIEGNGQFSIFHVDSSDSFTAKHMAHFDLQLQWIATAVLSRMNQVRKKSDIRLSLREQEVLRWTGDGKTTEQISAILMLSPSTINFHLRNAMVKLDAPNKMAAVVRAIFLDLLH